MSRTTGRVPLATWLRAVELLASMAVALLILVLPTPHLGLYFCLWGECLPPTAEELSQATRSYWVTVGLLGVAFVVAFAAAIRRRAWLNLLWHVPTAVVAVLVALLSIVPSVDWRDRLVPDPPARDPGTHYVPCHSGPPDDCPGG